MFKSVQKTILACMVCLFAVLLMLPGVAQAQQPAYGYRSPFCEFESIFISVDDYIPFPDCNEACNASPEIIACQQAGPCSPCAQ